MKNIFKIIILLLSFIVVFSCNDDNTLENHEKKYIEKSELTYFLESSNVNNSLSAKSGWPYTGCKSFNVKLGSEVIFGTVEFTLNHCCVKLVCSEESVWNILDGLFSKTKDYKKPSEITIFESSSLTIGDYMVKIKPGEYSLDNDGKIESIVYIGEIIK